MKKFKTIRFPLILITFAFLQISTFFAQTPAELRESVKYERAAVENYKAKDFSAFLLNMEKADALRPGHSRLIYNTAVAYALNGLPGKALANLERLAAMGLYFNITEDEDFKTLFGEKRFKPLQDKFAKNKEALNRSQKAFSLSEKNLITESVAFDPPSGTFFVGSVHLRKIVSIDKSGAEKVFSDESDGLWSVLGMKVDSGRRLLWVCTTAFPQMSGYENSLDGKSGIFKYDLKTGKLLKRYILDNQNEKHALGDLTLARDGSVFATDSLAPKIYKIAPESESADVFMTSENFNSLQGITFSDDHKNLFVADYSTGIYKIDLKTKGLTQIVPAENITLLGIDGLYFYKNKLIAVQNGIRPHRVVIFNGDKNFTKISKFEILEANHKDFEEPTLGVLIGNEFYYVANSQWNFTTREGKLPEDKLKVPVILKLKLQ